jgi:hypothetical protein
MNKSDSTKYAEITRKFEGTMLFCQVSGKPVVGSPRVISAPVDNGIIEFGAVGMSGDIVVDFVTDCSFP